MSKDEHIFPNTLAHVEGERALYFSLWMNGLHDATAYDGVYPKRSPWNLELREYPEPLPVMTDLATLTYLRDRRVRYLPEAYRRAEDGQVRVRISGVAVERRAAGADAVVDLRLEAFLDKFLAERLDASLSDDDDDDDQPHRRRRRAE